MEEISVFNVRKGAANVQAHLLVELVKLVITYILELAIKLALLEHICSITTFVLLATAVARAALKMRQFAPNVLMD